MGGFGHLGHDFLILVRHVAAPDNQGQLRRLQDGFHRLGGLFGAAVAFVGVDSHETQVHQIGAELIGDPGPESDAEVLLMLLRFLKALEFEDLVVLLNTVGDEESRVAYREALSKRVPGIEEICAHPGEEKRHRLDGLEKGLAGFAEY